MDKRDELRLGFETAYIDGSVASNSFYSPQFVSNNYKDGKKVLSSIEDELLRCDKFQISVAFITLGGITPLLQTLKELEKKNIPGEILTTNYLNFSEPRALEKLNGLSNITLKMYDVQEAGEGFHTKGYIFRTGEVYQIIIGSSNMTSTALTSNQEWNTRIISTEQGKMAEEIISEFDCLWNSQHTFGFDDFYENYLQLGICSSDVEYKSNETGSILCFVKEGELWCYNATEKKLSQVFSFRGYEGIDSRENHKEHDIRIIKVDETGSADFVVYGYMNRGNHEGQVGVGVYHYDSVANTVEEELFIPSTHSYEVLKSELGQLMYENESGMFYIMMGGTLYEINLATTKEKEVVSGFETGNYAVSENNQFVAYIADGNSDSGSKITVLNLENSKSFEVAAATGIYGR